MNDPHWLILDNIQKELSDSCACIINYEEHNSERIKLLSSFKYAGMGLLGHCQNGRMRWHKSMRIAMIR